MSTLRSHHANDGLDFLSWCFQDAPCGDLFTHLCCHMCANCQEHREMCERTTMAIGLSLVSPPPTQRMGAGKLQLFPHWSMQIRVCISVCISVHLVLLYVLLHTPVEFEILLYCSINFFLQLWTVCAYVVPEYVPRYVMHVWMGHSLVPPLALWTISLYVAYCGMQNISPDLPWCHQIGKSFSCGDRVEVHCQSCGGDGMPWLEVPSNLYRFTSDITFDVKG
jgi:hypothetical protein